MKYGLLGKDVSHSFSQSIHERSQPIKYTLYSLDSLTDFFKTTGPFAGNVTMPYKTEVLQYMDVIDAIVEKTQVANVITHNGQQWRAFNTDAPALINTLKHRLPKDNKCHISILGNGATTRSLVYALELLGYLNYHVYARHPKAGEHALESLDLKTSVLCQTTPVGMVPHTTETLVPNLGDFNHLSLVVDLVNNPLKTQLMIDAMTYNIPVCGGIHMLFEQARLSQKLFGLPLHEESDFNQFKHAWIFDHINIVFIGMPFAGKTTLASQLSKVLSRVWIDTDQVITKDTQQTIEMLFRTSGESHFRTLEKDVVLRYADKHQHIISTGGGVIENKGLMTALKKQAIIVYLAIDPALIQTSMIKDRPLIQTIEDWHKLHKKRDPLYRDFADITLLRTADNEANLLDELVVKLHAIIDYQWT